MRGTVPATVRRNTGKQAIGLSVRIMIPAGPPSLRMMRKKHSEEAAELCKTVMIIPINK